MAGQHPSWCLLVGFALLVISASAMTPGGDSVGYAHAHVDIWEETGVTTGDVEPSIPKPTGILDTGPPMTEEAPPTAASEGQPDVLDEPGPPSASEGGQEGGPEGGSKDSKEGGSHEGKAEEGKDGEEGKEEEEGKEDGEEGEEEEEEEEGAWILNERTYVTIESLLLMALIVLAVCYELILKYLKQAARSRMAAGSLNPLADAYRMRTTSEELNDQIYAEEKELSPEAPHETYHELFNRLAAELMVLGLMAFTVWSAEKTHDFDEFASAIKTVTGVKISDEELKETTENIHMQLFIAMVLLFLAQTGTIYAAKHNQLALRRSHLRIEAHRMAAHSPTIDTPELTEEDLQYEQLRFYFLAASCHIDTQGEPLHDEMPRPTIPVMAAAWQPGQLGFDFSRYLSLSLDTILEDLTDFAVSTWVFCCLVELVVLFMCVNSEPSKGADFAVELLIAVVGPAFTLGTLAWAKIQESAIVTESNRVRTWAEEQIETEKRESTGRDRSEAMVELAATQIKEAHRVVSKLDDKWPMRLIQAGTFFSCYSCARILASKRVYAGEMYRGSVHSTMSIAAMIILFAMIYALQLCLQSSVVRQCTTVLALPPFVDSTNAETAVRVSRVSSIRQYNDYVAAGQVLGVTPEYLYEHLPHEVLISGRKGGVLQGKDQEVPGMDLPVIDQTRED